MKKTLVALVCLSLVAPAFAKSRGFSSPSRSFSSPSRSFSKPAPKPAAPAPSPKPVTPPPAVTPSKPAAPTKSAGPAPAATQPTSVYREREVVHESSSGGFLSTATGVVGGMMLYNWLFGSKEAAAAPVSQSQPTEAAKSPTNSECVRSPATNECVQQK